MSMEAAVLLRKQPLLTNKRWYDINERHIICRVIYERRNNDGRKGKWGSWLEHCVHGVRYCGIGIILLHLLHIDSVCDSRHHSGGGISEGTERRKGNGHCRFGVLDRFINTGSYRDHLGCSIPWFLGITGLILQSVEREYRRGKRNRTTLPAKYGTGLFFLLPMK